LSLIDRSSDTLQFDDENELHESEDFGDEHFERADFGDEQGEDGIVLQKNKTKKLSSAFSKKMQD
jgi:hypothetical protein